MAKAINRDLKVGDRVSWKLRGQIAGWERRGGQRVTGIIERSEGLRDDDQGEWFYVIPDHRTEAGAEFRNASENEPAARLKLIA